VARDEDWDDNGGGDGEMKRWFLADEDAGEEEVEEDECLASWDWRNADGMETKL
jgi:hypothetical protein